MADTKSPQLEAAETAKALAEADEARARLRKHEAEAAKFAAETEAQVVLTESTRLELRQEELRTQAAERNARREEYQHASTFASDDYHHVYRFNDPVSASSTQKCMAKLTQWRRMDEHLPKKEKHPIKIVFSSPGGSVIDGMALYDFIQEVRGAGHKVVTATIGYAASMAGILLQAGDVRAMGAESYLLIHEVSFGAGGKIGEVEDEVTFVKKIQSRVLDIFAARSNLSKAQIARRWERRDWWLDSREALKLGFIDEIA